MAQSQDEKRVCAATKKHKATGDTKVNKDLGRRQIRQEKSLLKPKRHPSLPHVHKLAKFFFI